MTPSIFHERWWLDAAAPGAWQEVQVEENGAPVARLPFYPQRFLSFRLLLAPPMSTRLGPLVDTGEGRYETRLRRFDHLVDELIDQLPPFDMFRQTFHPDVLSWLPFHRKGFRVEPQISYVLDDLSDPDKVWAGISGQTRRVIKTASKSLEIQADDDSLRLDRMVRSTFRRQSLEAPYEASMLHRVARACLDRDRATVLSAVDAAGMVHATLFCVRDERRTWYLAGGGDPELRSSGAGSMLMWELIKDAAKRGLVFDFEGSMIPGVERYFRNFGGRQETYFAVTRTSARFAPVWAAYQRGQRGRAGRAMARLREIIRPGDEGSAG